MIIIPSRKLRTMEIEEKKLITWHDTQKWHINRSKFRRDWLNSEVVILKFDSNATLHIIGVVDEWFLVIICCCFFFVTDICRTIFFFWDLYISLIIKYSIDDVTNRIEKQKYKFCPYSHPVKFLYIYLNRQVVGKLLII